MINRLSRLWQKDFIRNVATLQVGIFVGNFLQAAAGVVLARLLQPERYGIYVLAFSLAGLLSILLGAGMQDAIASIVGGAKARGDRDEILNSFAFLLKMAVITGLIVVGVIPFLGSIAGHFYGNSTIGLYAGIIIGGSIISMFFFSFSQIALQISNRIRMLTGIVIADQVFRYGSAILLVLAGFGIFGAIAGQFIGASITLIVSVFVWRHLARHHDIPSARAVIGRSFGVPIKKYFGFSFWVALDRNLATLYYMLPVALTGIYVASSEVSYFKLAFGFVNLALTLLGPISILLNIEFPKMKIDSESKLYRNFMKVSLCSVGLSAILTIGAIIISPFAFRILYGQTFLPSIPYIAGLIVYGSLFGIGVGLGPMWRAINKVKVSILINSITLGTGIPLGLWLIKNYGLWGSVIMVTIWFTASHFASFIYLAKQLKKV